MSLTKQASKPRSPFHPLLPQGPAQSLHWSDLHGSGLGLAASQAAQHYKGPVLILTADTPEASRLEYEVRFFTGAQAPLPVLNFPDWETLPYDSF
jgi:transcription-repair coupling factor (superfamily II helicase)